jgi:hypothetical protein
MNRRRSVKAIYIQKFLLISGASVGGDKAVWFWRGARIVGG